MPEVVPQDKVIVRNRRRQPVELHLPGGVVVIPPLGQCEVAAANAAFPQLAWLVARKALYLTVPPPSEAPLHGVLHDQPKAVRKSAARTPRSTSKSTRKSP